MCYHALVKHAEKRRIMAIKHINAAVFAAIAIVAGGRTPEPPAEWDDRLPDPATLKINEGRKMLPKTLLVNGEETDFAISTVGESRYVDATVSPKDGVADFEVLY